jgi:hypothetical protein
LLLALLATIRRGSRGGHVEVVLIVVHRGRFLVAIRVSGDVVVFVVSHRFPINLIMAQARQPDSI